MALHHFPRITTDGLVLCLDAGNPLSYTSGDSVWKDLSGNGNDGTLINGPTFSSSNGGSLVFNGTNYVLVDIDTFIRTNEAYTFECQFYLNISNSAGHFNVMNNPNPDNLSDGFWQHLNLTNNTWFWRTEDITNGERGGTVGPALPAGQWYNVTNVVKENQLKFYVNGTIEYTINTNFKWSDLRTDRIAYVIIGAGYGTNSRLNGSISNFKAYTKELSSSEIQQNYLATKGRYGL